MHFHFELYNFIIGGGGGMNSVRRCVDIINSSRQNQYVDFINSSRRNQ
jgi:hypothetical protein